MNHHASATGGTQSDRRRFGGAGLIFVGRLLLIFSLLFAGVGQWLGLPATTTPLRLAVFGVLGLMLGLAGYRLASGRWAGAFQLPLQAAAVAGVLFVAVMLKVKSGGNRPAWPPVWLIAVAVLAPLSWWLVAPKRRRQRQPRTLEQ